MKDLEVQRLEGQVEDKIKALKVDINVSYIEGFLDSIYTLLKEN
jgi:hypothetical protein